MCVGRCRTLLTSRPYRHQGTDATCLHAPVAARLPCELHRWGRIRGVVWLRCTLIASRWRCTESCALLHHDLTQADHVLIGLYRQYVGDDSGALVPPLE